MNEEYIEEMCEGDIAIQCNGWKYSVGVIGEKHIGTFEEYEDAVQAVKDYMEDNQFWPSVWFVSDHGNVSPTDL